MIRDSHFVHYKGHHQMSFSVRAMQDIPFPKILQEYYRLKYRFQQSRFYRISVSYQKAYPRLRRNTDTLRFPIAYFRKADRVLLCSYGKEVQASQICSGTESLMTHLRPKSSNSHLQKENLTLISYRHLCLRRKDTAASFQDHEFLQQ